MTRVLRYLLVLCLLAPWLAWADTLHLDTQARDAAGYLERLNDPRGELDAESAMAADRWAPMPAALNAGFTHDVIWLRLRVQGDNQSASDWMLALSNALLDEVTLYDFASDGTVRELRSGEALDRSSWPVAYRAATFPLNLTPDQPHWLLLRLQTKNAMSVSVRLMPDLQFNQLTRAEYLGFGLYFGIYLALIVFHFVFWRMTRAPESGWYLLYVSCCFSIEMLSSGLLQQVSGMPMGLSDRLLGCMLAASLPIGFLFAQRQLQVTEYAVFRRVMNAACLVIAVLAGIAILANNYQLGAPLVQTASLLTIPVLIGMALRLLFKGQSAARFFLLVFGIYYAGVIVSFMRNLGVLPTSFFTDNAVALGTLVHMILMSMRIIHHYRRLEEEKHRAQDDLKQVLQDQNDRLEQEIATRTQELREEIGRRTLLEGELRDALRQEQQIREEQRDFVAMVSHEFRTPLAIIATSAQQIARNLSAPPERNEQRCQNIREASSRLLSLVDNYLNHDRMAETGAELRSGEQVLPQLIERSAAELPSGRVHIDNQSIQQTLTCDGGLIKIALRNLIANADRHAPPDSVIRLALNDRQGTLDIRVFNEGPAIPKEQSTLLFQKYFRGSQAQQSPGAGLGLHLVKRIAELHGGEICLESTGAEAPICFRLSLPVA